MNDSFLDAISPLLGSTVMAMLLSNSIPSKLVILLLYILLCVTCSTCITNNIILHYTCCCMFAVNRSFTEYIQHWASENLQHVREDRANCRQQNYGHLLDAQRREVGLQWKEQGVQGTVTAGETVPEIY